jgi:hypothetical protein
MEDIRLDRPPRTGQLRHGNRPCIGVLEIEAIHTVATLNCGRYTVRESARALPSQHPAESAGTYFRAGGDGQVITSALRSE